MEMLSAAKCAAAFAIPQETGHPSTGEPLPGLLAPEEFSQTERAAKLEQGTFCRRKIFPIAVGETIADREGLSVIEKLPLLRLPRILSKLRSWENIVDKQIGAFLEQHGEDAFKDRRIKTKDPSAYALLSRVLTGRREPVVELTADAALRLRTAHGEQGFLEVDRSGRQVLYRCILDAKGDLVEFWLSHPALAESLGGELKRQSRDFQRLNLHEHGRSVMELLLGQIGKSRTNPVEIPAEVLRALLWAGTNAPQDWKQTVERTFGALMGLTCAWKRGRLRGEAVFVNSWEYIARGKGGHREGIYVVGVTAPFLGTLAVFEAESARLPCGVEGATYNFEKDLSKTDKKSLSYATFDSGRVFYDAAAGLTGPQRAIAHWIEAEITKKRDPVARGGQARKVRDSAPDAYQPRIYESSFCPILPLGQEFIGALGHFRHSPETGRTLLGTVCKTKSGKVPDGHVGGIAAVAYPQFRKRTCNFRRDISREVLKDLKAVVVNHCGGVVVGKLAERHRSDAGKGDLWLSLERFAGLDEKTLCHKLKIIPLLPPDWNNRRRKFFEDATCYRLTESVAEAQAAAYGPGARYTIPEPASEMFGSENASSGLPLPQRLGAALTHRGLKRIDLARIFNVTPGAVTRWLNGLKREEDPAKAKRIPEDLAVLMVRWVETGAEPTSEQLAALPSRHRTPRGGPRPAGAV